MKFHFWHMNLIIELEAVQDEYSATFNDDNGVSTDVMLKLMDFLEIYVYSFGIYEFALQIVDVKLCQNALVQCDRRVLYQAVEHGLVYVNRYN